MASNAIVFFNQNPKSILLAVVSYQPTLKLNNLITALKSFIISYSDIQKGIKNINNKYKITILSYSSVFSPVGTQ